MRKAKQNGSALPSKPLITPAELHKAKVLPISLNGIYAACISGQIECTRIGRKIIIPTAALRRKLGIEAA